MDHDVYAPPKSEILEPEAPALGATASRWSRLWASLLDAVTIMAVTIPTMYFTGGFEDAAAGMEPSLTYTLLVSLVGIAVFAAINAKLLIDKGQTVGKKVLRIRIVNNDDGAKLSKMQILKRYATYFIPGQIPFVGSVFSLVNILFIFGEQRRCLHDFVANTKVVEV